MKLNPLTACDFYKVGHKFQYPQGTTKVYSNFTPRSDRLANTKGNITFVGLQGFIKWFLIDTWNSEFFNKPKAEVVQHYKKLVDNALVCDLDVSHIEALHDLGYLPLEIKALPEGSQVGMKIPVFTVTNTHPDFFWLPNYLETAFSSEVWKICTTATVAREYRKILQSYAIKTGSPVDFVGWQGHDFSLRGLSGLHDGSVSAMGHLCSFLGTDTIPAIEFANNYYTGTETFVGGSVPATEHSVMSAGGKESEVETFRRILKTYPTGVVSIVSDTWDYWKVITEYTVQLKDEILARQPNAIGLAKTVFRPDSGDPVDIICGVNIPTASCTEDAASQIADKNAASNGVFKLPDGKFYRVYATWKWDNWDGFAYNTEVLDAYEVQLTPEQKGSIECLWEIFGGTITDKGYKLLDSHVGLIYGDSITLDRCKEIMKRLEAKGFASGNVVFGIGSYTYQYATRDTYGFAMKATAAVIDGQEVFLSKDPKTDSGTKKSATGWLAVTEFNGIGFNLQEKLSQAEEAAYAGSNCLETVFKDGVLTKETTLANIRTLINSDLENELQTK